MTEESQTEAEELRREPPEMDPEMLARREAALRHVRKFGDPVLKSRAAEVEGFDEALRAEIDRMGLLMEDAIGVGLAANQVGLLRRFFVYRVSDEGPLQALVNPVIDWSSDEEETFEEGCLSLPQVVVEVTRPAQIRVSAQDGFGEPLKLEVDGLEARVIQHELDHLDGVLIIDRTTRAQRREAMRNLRELGSGF
ncbi:MAG: peptide deformylase [Solirubrobacteraceae bacterium]|jgi:peptide deformylase|nr:peptide deformylase [Solirubrobacteraceae bacterium]